MDDNSVRVLRRFTACVQGDHGDCERSKRRVRDGVLVTCSCKCHADVDACITGLEKLLAYEEQKARGKKKG